MDDETEDFFGFDSALEAEEVDETGDSKRSRDLLNSVFDGENEEKEKKRKRKNPVSAASKLNEALLIGPKGIRLLEKLTQSFRPDPARDPYENLAVLMKKSEHWAHTMYPKFKFEDVIDQCERLGDRRPVKVFMMRSRLGMPMDEVEYEELCGKKKKPEDKLIGQDDDEQENRSPSVSRLSSPPRSPDLVQLLETETMSTLASAPPPPQAKELTDEERAKIAERRLKALEIREQKRREREEAENAKEKETEERKDDDKTMEAQVDEEAMFKAYIDDVQNAGGDTMDEDDVLREFDL